MAMWLKQSTASQEVLLGRFVDSTDGDSEMTGLTIANTDIKVWKDGATTLASKNSGGATHIAGGLYYAVLDATDTDTLGKLEIHVHVSGALAIKREFMVLPANVYDTLAVGTTALHNAFADALMQRASTNWEASAPAKSLGTAVMLATHHTEDDAGTLKVYRADGTTPHASGAITTNAAKLPIEDIAGLA